MPESLESPPRPDDAASPIDERHSRRNLLRSVSIGGAGALAVVLSACGGGDETDDQSVSTESSSSTSAQPANPDQSPAVSSSRLTIPGTGDAQIVNYALTLEYLEADFYAQVIASGVIKDKKIAELAKQFGEHEQMHVEALEKTAKTLGKPPAKPKTNFDSVLEAGPEKILSVAATVENVGAAAYLGQAPRIKDEEILAAALSIHSVEARHAAALNQAAGLPLVGKGGLEGSIPDGPFATPLSMADVLKRVQPFLA